MLIYPPAAARSSRANLAGLGASASATYAKQGASVGASVGSVVPVIGTVVGAAIGAVVGAIGGAFVGSRRPESDLWDQYKKISGTARGIELDPAFRAGAFVGLMRFKKNTFPPRARGGYGPKDDARFLDDMAGQVAAAVRAGKIGASDDAKSVFSKVVGPWIAQWGEEPNADWRRWENQIVTDQIDAYLYDMPIVATSYTQQRHAQPRLSEVVKAMTPPAPPPLSTPAPAAKPPIATLPVPAVIAPPVALLPAPAAIAPPVSSIAPGAPPASSPSSLTPAAADNTRAVIDALLAQGASSQQAIAAAMQSLAAQGVQPTPQIQQAVAEEVQSKTQAIPWPWILGGGGLALTLAAVLLTRRRSRR
jgi:hypothetical protein